MFRKTVFIIFLCLYSFSHAQYRFQGQIAEHVDGKTIYLSIIEDYRKLSRISLDQVIKKTSVDSLGQFTFEGNNLSPENRIYRIHVDGCADDALNSNHFFGSCEYSRSILFIANSRDTISFPTSFADEVLCEITSTNSKSAAFLDIDILKEEMAFDFTDFRSAASRKLNSKKWFNKLQDFGENLDEPLAELYIFDVLSDKRNDTYSYYLNDVENNDYYEGLQRRLESKYPNTEFTEQYIKELSIDRQLAFQGNDGFAYWKWILASLLILSLLLNFHLLRQKKVLKKNGKNSLLEKLTAQEQKIIDEILMDKTNKEIAADLFISLSTVKTHINNLYKKLNVSSREEMKQLF